MPETMTPREVVELKPCPFCNHERPSAVMDRWTTSGDVWFVECDAVDCEARGPEAFGEEAAIAAWNRRPAAPSASDEGECVYDFECDGCDAGDRCMYVGSLCNPALRDHTSEPAREAVALLRKVHSSALPIEMSKTFDWTVPASVIKDIDKYLDTHPAPATADKLRGIIDAATDAALPPVCDVTGSGTKERASIQVEIANRIIAALTEEG